MPIDVAAPKATSMGIVLNPPPHTHIHPMKKQRLAYIDLMKGLCIMLIVMHHTDEAFFDSIAPNLDNALQSFRVPMYYFLSGLFFKTYSGFAEFLKRKVNNLVVPLIFFHVVGFIVAGATFMLLHPGQGFNWQAVLYPATHRFWPYTMALWFLISLFEVNIIYYAMSRCLGNRLLRTTVVLLLSVVPLVLVAGGRHITLPFMLDTACVGLPFFAIGNAVSQAGLIKPHKADRWGMAVFPAMAVVIYIGAGHIDILEQEYPSWLQLYALPAVAILSLMWLCKNITRRIPVIATWGQYSLIVLGTHDWLLTPLDLLLAGVSLSAPALALVKWGITMAAMLLIIPALVRLVPQFTAQKPLIPIKTS